MRTPAVWPAFSYFWLFSIAFPLALADRLQLGAVVGLGLVAAALGVYFSGRSMSAQEPLTGWPVAAAGLVGILLTTATWLRPMTFVDTYFRWDFLARLLLERGSISFYPPLEFDVYYYPDGIPPLISFSYWLLYAAAGAWTPSLTALMIGVQYAACLGLTFALARTLGGSGALAVGVLVSSAEFLRSIAMGQETGVTCMSVLAICVILICEEATWKSALAAGIAAGVGALAREYGLAFVLAGIIVMGWRRRPARDFLVYVAAWAVVALPWYARTWMMTGNPLYDNPSGTFPGNPVHVALLNTYAFIWSHQPERWWEVFRLLCVTAWAPLFLGLIGALATMRRNLDVVLCIALVVGLFVLSCGYTAAGPVWAARVLAPALALLAALAGACAPARWPRATTAAATGLCLLSVPTALIWPSAPAEVPLRYWPAAAVERRAPAPYDVDQMEAAVRANVAPEGVILTDGAVMPVRIRDRRFVLVWSPQALFLFDGDPSNDAEGLRRLGVRAVICSELKNTLNGAFLRQFPFFSGELPRWRQAYVSRAGDVLWIAPNPSDEPVGSSARPR